MGAYPKPKPPLEVKIVSGPHGRSTTLEIAGQPVSSARSFTLHADCDGATTLTVEYTNVKVEVDALVEETAFNAENKSHRHVRLIEPDDGDA